MKKLIPYFFKLLSKVSPKLAAKLALKLFVRPRKKPRSAEEMEFLQTGRKMTFKSHRKARIWGEGPIIWLIHGWESRGSTFYKMIPSFVSKGYQVVAWDGPAHGDSPGNTNTVPGNAEALSDDMNENLFSQAVAIVGHSFGGATLAVLSKLQPMSKKVVIVSAPTRIDDVFTRFATMIKLGDKAGEKFIQLSQISSGYSFSDVSLVNNDISDTSDVLVIHDQGDDVIPFEDFTILKKAWKSGDFIATNGFGHRLTIKDPGMINTIVDFCLSA